MIDISSKGVPCFNTYGGEIYMDKAFENSGLRPSIRLPNARELGKTCLQFLVHPTLNENHIEDMCLKISKVVNKIKS